MPRPSTLKEPLQAIWSEHLNITAVALLERQIVGSNEHPRIAGKAGYPAMAIARHDLHQGSDHCLAHPSRQALVAAGVVVSEIAIVAAEKLIAADAG